MAGDDVAPGREPPRVGIWREVGLVVVPAFAGMDDATNEHSSMRFVEEEGRASSFLEVSDVIERRGLFAF